MPPVPEPRVLPHRAAGEPGCWTTSSGRRSSSPTRPSGRSWTPRRAAAEFRRGPHAVLLAPPRRVVPLAAVGYALCVAEIADQLESCRAWVRTHLRRRRGATGAGVALGAAALGLSSAVRLICPMHWPWHIPTAIAADANAAAERLGIDHRLRPEDIDADENFIAPGYGLPSPAGREALHLLATTEAILTDPVYSAKALAGLIADVRARKYRPGSVLVFFHTGGVPAVFADPTSVLT
ncbi:MAG: pyridoxal-phosphate dependent enzyme [Gemmataceae bacterium]